MTFCYKDRFSYFSATVKTIYRDINWYTADSETNSGSKFSISLVSVVTVRIEKLTD